MKLGIMQPYFFPYIGYWQLINVVDTYVLFDDVNFINRGWIHRNRILINGEPSFINVPMIGASQNKKINEIEVNNDEKMVRANLNKLQSAYGKAPEFKGVFPVIEDILRCGKPDLASYNTYLINKVRDYLGIDTEIIRSSEINKNGKLKAQAKILDICNILGADIYVNAIGGRELYDQQAFDERGIELKFLQPGNICYRQFDNVFVGSLSIIDVMMFNTPDRIRQMLEICKLVD